MARYKKSMVFSCVVVILVAGICFLASRDIPAPQKKTEKAVSNDLFFKK